MAGARRVAPSNRRAASRAPSGAALARDTFARDWTRRTKTLKRIALASRDEFSVDDVHDLRVTTRRLRASLAVLRHCATDAHDRNARRELRALGGSLGVCRMLDIAIRDARAYRIDTAPLEKRRARANAALQRALKRTRMKALLSGLRRIERVISEASLERLSPWLQGLEWELAYLLEVPPRTPEARHELRIQMKKVRYVLESFGRRSASLEKLQDHLGREHDLAVLKSLVGTHARVTGDERRARARADRVRLTALRSAMRHLHAIRRDVRS